MKRNKVYRHDGLFFPSIAALARYIKVPASTLKTHIKTNQINQGAFTYKTFTITIINSI